MTLDIKEDPIKNSVFPLVLHSILGIPFKI